MLLTASIVGLFVLPGPWNAIFFGTALVLEIGEIFLWVRFLDRYRVRGGAEGMIGERGTVIARCDPSGLVRVRGEVWKASADLTEPLAEGELISVLAVEGLTVRVAKRER